MGKKVKFDKYTVSNDMLQDFGFNCLSCKKHFKGRCYIVSIEFINKETQKPEYGFRRFCNKCG